jgi:acyl-CoA synthetase (NDP forming)
MADLATAAGLDLPELRPDTQARLRELIPGYLRVSNPVDSGGGASADERGKLILDAILADPAVDVLVCPITGAASMGNRLAKDLVVKAAEHGKPVWVVWGSPVGDEPAYRDILLPSGLPVFRSFGNCVRALSARFATARFHERYRSPFDDVPAEPLAGTGSVRALLERGTPRSERDAKTLLAAYVVPVSRDVLAATPAEAAKAAAEIGTPVVVKVCSAQLTHKSDLGLVRLGVTSPAEAERAAGDLLARAAEVAPAATVDGVIVSEQLAGGVETLVGVSTDQVFGPVVTVGIGGVLVEVLGDVAHRVPPFDAA